MAYDEKTARRVRQLLTGGRGVTEQKMFGGLAFLVNGHMCCGVLNDTLVLRLGEDGARAALQRPHTAPMDFTGKPMKSMVYVRAEGHRTAVQLRRWVEQAVTYARSLPKK
jgi:TfoX/Sxy family transcriptional regulator of competence genes